MNKPKVARFTIVFGGEGEKQTRLRCNNRNCQLLIMPASNQKHMEKCHPQLEVSGYIFTCDICNASFDCIRKSRKHHQRHRQRHICEHCKTTFYHEFKFKHHTERCDFENHLYYKRRLAIYGREERLYVDRSKCKGNADANSNLGSPIASFTLVFFNGSSILCCDICEFYMYNHISLCTRHVQRSHPHLEKARIVFACGSCGDSFYDSEEASMHHQLHKQCSEHHHFCNKCYSVFESEDMLSEHESNCRESADSYSGLGYDIQLLDDLLDTLNQPSSMVASV